MDTVATGQITIIDTNDSIFTGTTAPASPVANVTLWVDTSLSPNQLKKWTGTAWEIVNEVVVGGRNYFPLSYIKDRVGISIVNSSAFTMQAWASTMMTNAQVLSLFKPSTTYCYSIKYTLQTISTLPVYDHKIGFALYSASTGLLELAKTTALTAVNNSVTLTGTFSTPADLADKYLIAYSKRYTDGITVELGKVLIERFKIEVGNKTTDWTAAPEDVDAVIATAQTTADGKSRHFTGSTNPSPPYTQGLDTWTNGTDLYECAVTRAAGAAYVAGDFVKATGYDNTKTVIDGGVVTAGTIQLAGNASTILAGITGEGTAGSSVRMWAGASYANRATAPFRVQQNGTVYSKASFEVQNQNNETNAGFSGYGTGAEEVRIWAGSDYVFRATAPFQVLQNGTAKMTAIEIKTNANTTGRRLEMSSSNNNLAMFIDNIKVMDLISDYDTTDNIIIPAIKLNDANFLWSNIMYANKTVLSRGGIFCKLDYKGITLSSDSGTSGTTSISRSSISTGFLTASNQVQFTGISSAYPSESGVVYRDSNGFLKIR